MMDLQRKVAEAISAFLNAPLIALYTLMFLFFSLHPSTSPSFLFIGVFFGSIFPITIVLYMAKKEMIPDFYASERRTRTKPLVIALVCLLMGIVSMILLQAPQIFISLMTCYFVSSFAVMVITLVWKISIHTSGITAAATFLVYHLGTSMLPFFMLLFPVGWARIRLKAHSLAQVVGGVLFTIFLVSLQLVFFN